MRRYTGVRAATISVERGFVSGGEGFNVSEGSNGVTIDKGKVTLYLAACVTGERVEVTAW